MESSLTPKGGLGYLTVKLSAWLAACTPYDVSESSRGEFAVWYPPSNRFSEKQGQEICISLYSCQKTFCKWLKRENIYICRTTDQTGTYSTSISMCLCSKYTSLLYIWLKLELIWHFQQRIWKQIECVLLIYDPSLGLWAAGMGFFQTVTDVSTQHWSAEMWCVQLHYNGPDT